MKKLNEKALSTFCILIAGIMWGTMAIFVGGLKKYGFSSVQCTAIRCTFSSLLLLVLIVIKDYKLLKISLKDLPVFLGLGSVGVAMFSLCYFSSIQILNGASVPSLLLNTAPIFVMIIAAVFFKEKITLKKVIALVLALVGVACVSGVFSVRGEMKIDGIIFGILSGLGYAMYSVLTKSVANKYHPLVINFYAFLIAALIVAPASGIFSKLETLASWGVVGYSFGLVILCTILPFVVYSFGLKGLNVSTVSVMAMVDPLTATVVGLLFMNEGLSPEKIIGIILVVVAIVVLNLNFNKKEKIQTQ